jgi:hypothetical protein
LFGITISCAWKIWEEPDSAPPTQDKYYFKICIFTIAHTHKKLPCALANVDFAW